MKFCETFITFFIYLVGFEPRGSLIHGKNIILPDLYWNTTNPIFLISNTDHIIDVNQATAIHEYDTINIVCPKYDKNTQDESMERHVIYNVNKEEYDTCRILSESPRIIGFCTEPTRERLFTISFRSFSPKPNSIEFERGKSYYFISTSSPGNLRTKQGGYCVHNNMKVVFKVADKTTEQGPRAKTPISDMTFNSVKEKVINSQAKAVVAKWKEEKTAEKSYFYNRQHDSSKRAKESNMIKESQSILDRQSIKDKMLSDEQSRFFYTTSKVMEINNAKSEESLLEKFSSSAVALIPVSWILVSLVALRPFISC